MPKVMSVCTMNKLFYFFRQQLSQATLRDKKIERTLVNLTDQARYLKEENKKLKELQNENNFLKVKMQKIQG